MLKVGSPQPPQEMMPPMPMDDDIEQMEDAPIDPQAQPPMDTQGMMPDDQMENGQDNPFDTNFDAGVDADEETDPKTYIQQLTGKLSQTLNQYNSELPQTDSDLNKYVAGMILQQTTKGLSQDDVKDVLDNMQDEENTNESKISRGMQIDEIFNDIMQSNEDDEIRPAVRNIGFRKKPYISPEFK